MLGYLDHISLADAGDERPSFGATHRLVCGDDLPSRVAFDGEQARRRQIDLAAVNRLLAVLPTRAIPKALIADVIGVYASLCSRESPSLAGAGNGVVPDWVTTSLPAPGEHHQRVTLDLLLRGEVSSGSLDGFARIWSAGFKAGVANPSMLPSGVLVWAERVSVPLGWTTSFSVPDRPRELIAALLTGIADQQPEMVNGALIELFIFIGVKGDNRVDIGEALRKYGDEAAWLANHLETAAVVDIEPQVTDVPPPVATVLLLAQLCLLLASRRATGGFDQ